MAKPDSRTDAELIEAARTGDAAAFEAIYFRYRDWVVRVAMRFTNNQDDALETLQDTFAYLLRKLPNLYLSARMTTFLYPVVKHTALRLKEQRRLVLIRDGVLEEIPDPAPPIDHAGSRDLAAVVANLPAEQREVILLRFVDDLPLAGIAETLRIPLGTVKSRLHYALAALRTDPRTRRYFFD